MNIEASANRFWPRSLLESIVLWAVFWSLLIGGMSAFFAWSSIRDSRFRADLARFGVITTALVTGESCGRSSNPKFQITIGGRTHRACAAEDFIPLATRNRRVSAPVTVAYDPKSPRRFVLAPGGVVPQRDISMVWQDWWWRTKLILAIYLPGVIAFILIRRRKAMPTS